jgi:hypothetical protein
MELIWTCLVDCNEDLNLNMLFLVPNNNCFYHPLYFAGDIIFSIHVRDCLSVSLQMLEDRGAKFVFRNPPAEFLGESGSLSGVKLQDGTVLEAQLCIIGAGLSNSHITFFLQLHRQVC